MLSIVSECHQFTVIKLIRPAALIAVPEIDRGKPSLVNVNCLSKLQSMCRRHPSHKTLQAHQLPSWKLMREFLAGCVGLVFSYYSLAFSTFLLQVEQTVYSILGTEMWALAGWRFDSSDCKLRAWLWREFTGLLLQGASECELSVDRHTPCKTSPLVEARVLIASGEWWIKVSWALHSHRNCIKGSSVLFIFMRYRLSRDLRNTCEKTSSDTFEYKERVYPAKVASFLLQSVCVFLCFSFIEMWRFWQCSAVNDKSSYSAGGVWGSPWMHEWIRLKMTFAITKCLGQVTRAGWNKHKYITLTINGYIFISICLKCC